MIAGSIRCSVKVLHRRHGVHVQRHIRDAISHRLLCLEHRVVSPVIAGDRCRSWWCRNASSPGRADRITHILLSRHVQDSTVKQRSAPNDRLADTPHRLARHSADTS